MTSFPPNHVATCPLCHHQDITLFHEDKRRPYCRCAQCLLVFVPSQWHLSPTAEKACYDQHDNQIHDPRYRQFLSRVFDPITHLVPSPAHGLEFGCGPGPALAAMFEETGYTMTLFDLYYHNHPEALNKKYDFITATEVIEHLAKPDEVINQLNGLLKPGAPLGLMTKLVTDVDAFSRWHYKADDTHISFFSRETFNWLGRQLRKSVQFHGNDVIIIK